jgi:hypothetical protein
VVLAVPMTTANAKVVEMYQDVDNNSYNKVYTFQIVVGNQTKVKELVYKRGSYIINNSNQIIGLTITFGTKYEREAVTVDGVGLKCINYQYSNKASRNAKRTGKVNKGQNVSLTRSWNLTFADDGSSKYDALVAEAYGLLGEHTITVKGVTYNVEMTSGSESYTETRSTLTCSFEEV